MFLCFIIKNAFMLHSTKTLNNFISAILIDFMFV